MSEQRWAPGTQITGRGLWFGRVFAAWPFVVVEETDELIAAYIPPGAVWKRPADLEGNDIRLPHGDWGHNDEVWHGHGAVRIFVRGASHSVLVFLEPGDVQRWYINLEEPFVRTQIGLDTRDNHLGLVFPGDLSSHRWKDEDELAEAVAFGSVSATEAAAFRAEGERVIELVRRGDHPAIDDRWRGWSPLEGWGVPVLAPEWETLSPSGILADT
ncbi:MAG: DUF402 domain-containing protein [Chloroflexi bacterium]|nr:DUF402 domain-containing protein [Chloroflexota bacterium]